MNNNQQNKRQQPRFPAPNQPPEPEQEQPGDVANALNNSLYRPEPDNTALAMGGGGYITPSQNSPGLVDWLLDRGGTRKHYELMTHNRHVTIETLEALNQASMITTDFVANSIETEATMEEIILSRSNSKLAMASAPMYIQEARKMQMGAGSAIANAGINRIKERIERR